MRSPPACSRQRCPTGTPHIGQTTEDNCFFVNSPIFIRGECHEGQQASCSFRNSFGETAHMPTHRPASLSPCHSIFTVLEPSFLKTYGRKRAVCCGWVGDQPGLAFPPGGRACGQVGANPSSVGSVRANSVEKAQAFADYSNTRPLLNVCQRLVTTILGESRQKGAAPRTPCNWCCNLPELLFELFHFSLSCVRMSMNRNRSNLSQNGGLLQTDCIAKSS